MDVGIKEELEATGLVVHEKVTNMIWFLNPLDEVIKSILELIAIHLKVIVVTQ